MEKYAVDERKWNKLVDAVIHCISTGIHEPDGLRQFIPCLQTFRRSQVTCVRTDQQDISLCTKILNEMLVLNRRGIR